jgi:hypothetical protein
LFESIYIEEGANQYIDGEIKTVYLDGDIVKDQIVPGIANSLKKAAE